MIAFFCGGRQSLPTTKGKLRFCNVVECTHGTVANIEFCSVQETGWQENQHIGKYVSVFSDHRAGYRKPTQDHHNKHAISTCWQNNSVLERQWEKVSVHGSPIAERSAE